MKKLAITLSALAALTGSAFAADLPARTYSKAPAMGATPSWTGLYLFGGIGGGIWDANSYTYNNTTGAPFTNTVKLGGDGWFGTVGAGYDWQFNGPWVAGIFADGSFGSQRGTITGALGGVGISGSEKLKDSWAAGARIGYLVAPSVLSYVNGGFTQSFWSSSALSPIAVGFAPTATTSSFNRSGWFVGGGVENQLGFFGMFGPNWFMKTEYRASYFNRANLVESSFATGLPSIVTTTFKPFVQDISTSLVYRFNWSGPMVAKY